MELHWPCMSLQSQKVSINKCYRRVRREERVGMMSCCKVEVRVFRLVAWERVDMAIIMEFILFMYLPMPLPAFIDRAFRDRTLE